jgi:hypothetical protein
MIADRGPGHVVIVGPSKTGTTGVYAAVKRGLAGAGVDMVTVFEPTSPRLLTNVFLLAPGRTLLTKTTIDKVARIVPDPAVFDRRVMTVRDPRDILISTLLFRPLTRRSVQRTDAAAVSEFVAALERKEADPAAISVRELFELAQRLGIGSPPFASLARDMKRQRRLLRSTPFHVVRYEDLVAGELSGLSDYLEAPIKARATGGSATFGHIARSASSGDYAHWFRPDDLTYFDDIFGPYLTELGYERPGRLADDPVIDPAVSSEYVRSRYEQRRAALQARTSRAASADIADDELDQLVSAADDGDATACVRVSKALLTAGLDERGGRSALQWARLGAQLGLPAAMAVTAELLEAGGATDAATRREAQMWRGARAVFTAEQKLGQVRRSAGYRVGTELVALARSPRRNCRGAVRELMTIWQQRNPKRAQRSAGSGSS